MLLGLKIVIVILSYTHVRVCYLVCMRVHVSVNFNVELFVSSGDCPLIVQFAANDARLLSDAARIVCPYANGIDINCGCPQR